MHGFKTFQSTRPRGARPYDEFRSFQKWYVSIHAPTGGATVPKMVRSTETRCFNPRAHGGRDINCRNKGSFENVSIHAPTGGATFSHLFNSTRSFCFNPRAHGGRDQRAHHQSACKKRFQSTRPRGARLLPPVNMSQF